MTPRTRRSDVRGFTLLELMLVVSILVVVGAMAVPAVNNMSGSLRVSSSSREVERELQTARLRAVQSNRPIRVRFNCPVAGQFRMVEVLGTTALPHADDAESQAATRCSETGPYGFPDPDKSFFAVPNHDGPIRRLPQEVAMSGVTAVEFRPDGTARTYQGSAYGPIPDEGVTLAVYDKKAGQSAPSMSRTIRVNSVGRVTLQ